MGLGAEQPVKEESGLSERDESAALHDALTNQHLPPPPPHTHTYIPKH